MPATTALLVMCAAYLCGGAVGFLVRTVAFWRRGSAYRSGDRHRAGLFCMINLISWFGFREGISVVIYHRYASEALWPYAWAVIFSSGVSAGFGRRLPWRKDIPDE